MPRDAFQPVGLLGARARPSGRWCSPATGCVDKELGIDDYAGLDVSGKIVVVRRFVPEHAGAVDARAPAPRRRPAPEGLARARARRARAAGRRPAGAPEGRARGLEAARRAAAVAAAAERLRRRRHPGAAGQARGAGAGRSRSWRRSSASRPTLEVALSYTTKQAFNVVGAAAGDRRGAAGAERAGVVVIGAHYDHLGLGEHHSLAPDSHAAAPGRRRQRVGDGDGARDRAAAGGEAGRRWRATSCSSRSPARRRGCSGRRTSRARRRAGLKIADVRAMINLDMVGRLRDNRATILGAASADGVAGAAGGRVRRRAHRLRAVADGGFGPSDQMPFYAAGVPVVHFFTGSHADYHKPTDTADRINAAGAAQIARRRRRRSRRASPRAARRSRSSAWPAPPAEGDARSFNASLGTIPDYAGPPGGAPGVLLAGVRGGAAGREGRPAPRRHPGPARRCTRSAASRT